MTSIASAGWPTDDPRVAEILEIVSRETSVEQDRLTPEASIAALDIASLDMVQAIFAIESHFNVEIPIAADQNGGEFTSVGDLVQHVLAAAGDHEPPA